MRSQANTFTDLSLAIPTSTSTTRSCREINICLVFAASDPSDLARVAPALAQFAVHVGWTFTGDDFSTPYNPQAVINNYLPFANQGQTGIILMHSVYNSTALALPALIENAKKVSGTLYLTTAAAGPGTLCHRVSSESAGTHAFLWHQSTKLKSEGRSILLFNGTASLVSPLTVHVIPLLSLQSRKEACVRLQLEGCLQQGLY